MIRRSGSAFRATRSSPRSPGAHAAAAAPRRRDEHGRTWVIDPLDGTVNYANGLPVFCVSIGFVVDGRPTAGAVLDPTRDETFAATADGPATLNGRADPGVDEGQAVRLRRSRSSLAGRSVASRARAIRKAIRVAALDGLGVARPGLRRQRPVRRVRPGERACRPGTSRPPGLIAERAGATVTAFDGGAGTTRHGRPGRSARRRAGGASRRGCARSRR